MKTQKNNLQFHTATILEINDSTLKSVDVGSNLGAILQALSIGTVALM
ncbi:hypothetical protein N7U66_12595 [Lacinutrix neustonica]|uniref:Uncharacterized protein n=1 Tax=Lacinutrix neustonica TaxID=2980107 RepID=A0A9E8MU60_9FLAO|nr:hypothetical protein [Lacinutrix neustonica]WAC01014.1 hypothetical protein N7U66_12595 [Lacinutrix neustonica]